MKNHIVTGIVIALLVALGIYGAVHLYNKNHPKPAPTPIPVTTVTANATPSPESPAPEVKLNPSNPVKSTITPTTTPIKK